MEVSGGFHFETGDIILFEGKSWLSYILEFGQGSRYSHVGIILENPTFIHPDWSGTYLLQSGYESDAVDMQSGKHLCGVQVTPIEIVLENSRKSGCKLWHRKLVCERGESFHDKFKMAYNTSIDKPYDFDVFDWISAKIDLTINKPWISYRKTNEFFCSALAAFIFVQLGFLDKDIAWTLIAPKQFSAIETEPLTFQECVLEKETQLII